MLIINMVEIYSPTGSEGELVDFLILWANGNGFKAYKDDAGNFIAEKGSGREILLVGHVDTVPGKIDVRLEDKKLFGRGTVDAKGALACFLEAAKLSDNGKVIIVGSVDEEGESKGAKYILKRYNPEFIIVGEPSGWSNLNIGYKGRINLFFETEREKEHSSAMTYNCYEECIGFYNRLKDYCESYNKEKSLFNSLGMKLLAINSGNGDFNEYIEMLLNFRTPLGFDLKDLIRFVNDIKGGANIYYSSFEKPIKVDKGNKLVLSFIRAIRAHGGEVKFKLKSGTSDMNVLQEYHVPMITYGPGDFRLEHTPNEYLDLDEYEKGTQILKMVLENI
jgi:LysW-gamma-L-lysine carboxypeptidase